MQPIIIDGLVVGKWDRTILQDMHAGGLTAANCTCCVWEDLEDTFKNVCIWKKMFRENEDLIMQVYDVDDIFTAKQADKVGVILGWQNISGFGDFIDSVPVFRELGIRIVQLTYNTANSVGSGCYESRDLGLTDYGRYLIWEMNAAGILVDLSHVGNQTAKDAIDVSEKPVAYTHTCPQALSSHPRNKSDDQLRYLAERDGFVGVAAIPTFLANGYDSTIADYVDAILHVRNVVGEDQVGLGTDLTQGRTQDFFDWIASDKGTGRKLVDMGGIPLLSGFETAAQYPKIVQELEKRGLGEKQIEKITGKNWIEFLKNVW